MHSINVSTLRQVAQITVRPIACIAGMCTNRTLRSKRIDLDKMCRFS